jgi:hypothetical protein
MCQGETGRQLTVAKIYSTADRLTGTRLPTQGFSVRSECPQKSGKVPVRVEPTVRLERVVEGRDILHGLNLNECCSCVGAIDLNLRDPLRSVQVQGAYVH